MGRRIGKEVLCSQKYIHEMHLKDVFISDRLIQRERRKREREKEREKESKLSFAGSLPKLLK